MKIKRLSLGLICLPLVLSACAYDPQSPFYPQQGVIPDQNYPEPVFRHRHHRKEHHKKEHQSPAPQQQPSQRGGYYDPYAGSDQPAIGHGASPAPHPAANQPTQQQPVPRPATNQPTQQRPAPRPAANQPTQQQPVPRRATNQPAQQQPAPRVGGYVPGNTQVPIGRGAG